MLALPRIEQKYKMRKSQSNAEGNAAEIEQLESKIKQTKCKSRSQKSTDPPAEANSGAPTTPPMGGARAEDHRPPHPIPPKP